MATTQKLAVNWDVALVSLSSIDTVLASYLPQSARTPRSDPVDLYPTRRRTLSGAVRGDGSSMHYWYFDYFSRSALDYLVDTYFTVSSTRVVSRKMTIYTRVDNATTGVYFARFNVYAVLPQVNVDYTPRAGIYENFRLPFSIVQML